jgi:endoglucanase
MSKKLNKLYIIVLFIAFVMVAGMALANNSPAKINFWNTRQKGANIFNCNIIADDIRDAKKYGITFIRLAPDKFISSHRDFLIGNADDYQGLVKDDLEKLKQVLNMFQKEGMPVVITMLSLPGSRWKQNNKDRDDLRAWKEEKYQAQAALFWQHLAAELKNYPIVVGYNILNEPHPERIFAPESIHINDVHQAQTQTMLYDFYKLIIHNIRLSDEFTPIILDSSAYADPKTFSLLKPHADKNILYSFHMYEPYEYTNHKMNNGKILYPGNIAGKQWNKNMLKNYMSAVTAFQKSHKIPVNRILVGEFGGHRMSPGLDIYFQDLISIFQEEGWHFAFYAFREDTWDGMDYELGDQKLPWSYWQAIEHGQKPHPERKDSYPVFSVIKDTYINP